MVDNMAGFGARRFAEQSLRKQEEMRRYQEEQRRYEQERLQWEQEQERIRWEQEHQQQQWNQQDQRQNDWNYQNDNGHGQGYDDWNGNGQNHDEYRDVEAIDHTDGYNQSNGIAHDGYQNQHQNYDNFQNPILNPNQSDPSRDFDSNHVQYQSSSSIPRFNQPQGYDDSSGQDYHVSSSDSHLHQQQGQHQDGDVYNRDWEDGGHVPSPNNQSYSSSDEDPYASNDWDGPSGKRGDVPSPSHQSHGHDQDPSLSRRIPERSPTIDSNGSTARLAYGSSSSDEADSNSHQIQYEQEEDEEVFRPPDRISVGNSTIRGDSGRNRFTNSTVTARSNTTPTASNFGARETFYDDGDEYEEEAWAGGNSSRYTRYEGNEHDRIDSDNDSEDYSYAKQASPSSSSSSSRGNYQRKSKGKLSSLAVPNESGRISSQPRLREKSPLSNASRSGGGRSAATTSMYAPAPQAKCADCGLDIPFEDLADHQCSNAPLISPTNLYPMESPGDVRSLSPSSAGSASPSFFDKYQNNVLKDGRSNSPAFVPPSRSNSGDQSGSKSPTPSIDLTPEERRRKIEEQRAAKKKGGAAIAATAVMASLRLAKGAHPSANSTNSINSLSTSSKSSTSSSNLNSSPTSYDTPSHKKQNSFSSADSNDSSLLGNGERTKFEMTPSTSFEGSLSPTSPREATYSKKKIPVDPSKTKSSTRSRSRSDSNSREDQPRPKEKSDSRSKKSSRDRSNRFDSRSQDQAISDSDSDLTPAQSPQISATFPQSNKTTSSSRNKSISPQPSKLKSSSIKKEKEEVDIGEIENLMNSLTSSPQKIKGRERERERDREREREGSRSKNQSSSSSRSRKTSESESPRKKDREREREVSKDPPRSKSSNKHPAKSSRPELSIYPSTAVGLSMREREKQKAERKHRKCAICQCSLASSKTLCVEQDGKLLCAKDWAELYLPKCRKCREPVESNAVKSADGALKGIFHRHCLCCFECDVAFDDGEFYIFENTPYCAEHYHIRNGSLCAACGTGIEGHCRQTESGERFHVRCLRCQYETGTEFCQESLEIFWELDGQKLCERHMEKTRRRLEKKGRKNVNASKRRTMLREIKN